MTTTTLVTRLRALFGRGANDGHLGSTVSAARAVELVRDGAALLDVRERHEWRTGHAPQAVHLPLAQLDKAPQRLPKEGPVVVVCASGMRSGTSLPMSPDTRDHPPEMTHVQSRTLHHLRQDNLDRLRPARRRRPVRSRPGPAVHLPVTAPCRPTTDTGPAHAARAEALQREAMTRLTATSGDQSLCTLSRDGSACSTAKYHEGAIAALAQARRALTAAEPGADPADPIRAVRARWVGQAGAGTTGAAWRAYLEGGRDGLDVLLAPAAAGTSPGPAAGTPPSATGPTAAGERAPGPASRVLVGSAAAGRLGGGRWPRRRVTATAVLTPALFAVLVAAGGGFPAPALWTVLVALVAVAAAATLATYLPGPGKGRRPALGCSPCAAMAAMTVLAAAWFVQAAPHQPFMDRRSPRRGGVRAPQRLTQTGASCAS